MSTIDPSITGRKLPATAVAARFGVNPRSLGRWSADEKLGFPAPIYINHPRYWDLGEIEQWERAHAVRGR